MGKAAAIDQHGKSASLESGLRKARGYILARGMVWNPDTGDAQRRNCEEVSYEDAILEDGDNHSVVIPSSAEGIPHIGNGGGRSLLILRDISRARNSHRLQQLYLVSQPGYVVLLWCRGIFLQYRSSSGGWPIASGILR